MRFLNPLMRLVRSGQYWLGVFSCLLPVLVYGVMPHCECPDLLDAFIRYESRFDRFIEARHEGIVPNEHGDYLVPPELRKCGVDRIWKEGGLIFFQGKLAWIDDPYEAIVKVLEPKNVFVSTLLDQHPKRNTLHVQYVLRANRRWLVLLALRLLSSVCDNSLFVLHRSGQGR